MTPGFKEASLKLCFWRKSQGLFFVFFFTKAEIFSLRTYSLKLLCLSSSLCNIPPCFESSTQFPWLCFTPVPYVNWCMKAWRHDFFESSLIIMTQQFSYNSPVLIHFVHHNYLNLFSFPKQLYNVFIMFCTWCPVFTLQLKISLSDFFSCLQTQFYNS